MKLVRDQMCDRCENNREELFKVNVFACSGITSSMGAGRYRTTYSSNSTRMFTYTICKSCVTEYIKTTKALKMAAGIFFTVLFWIIPIKFLMDGVIWVNGNTSDSYGIGTIMLFIIGLMIVVFTYLFTFEKIPQEKQFEKALSRMASKKLSNELKNRTGDAKLVIPDPRMIWSEFDKSPWDKSSAR